jgi:hypothetical protein
MIGPTDTIRHFDRNRRGIGVEAFLLIDDEAIADRPHPRPADPTD